MASVEFGDHAAVEVIREALWRRSGSRATVMVGAGFSRNAKPTSTSVREMPTWTQMAHTLCKKLYPNKSEAQSAALREATSTSGFLRLAQEYKVAFGQGSLNETIRSLVPDTEYEPGTLHYLLLNLPWTDVHTTNWDTLLERTADDIFDIDYNIIRTFSEIPSSQRPRIVKLHGSFPAHEPFVFTEEEYRTYPLSHAPFVNLVQQSLMESVLCLIGFSGDDPNFLHWSGWVRDNLGIHAPKIYLVGWLDLSHHRRRMLEDRNVVPIDLSKLPDARHWPNDKRYSYATEWFLRAISIHEHYDPAKWPTYREHKVVLPAYISSLPILNEITPLPELDHPQTFNDEPLNSVVINECIQQWRWNRHLYPDWMIAPKSVRDHIWEKTQNWINIIANLKDILHPIDYLFMLDELNWRLEVCLAPHFIEVITAAEITLARIDPNTRTVVNPNNLECQTKFDWTTAIEAWCRITLMLASDARMSSDFERADKMHEAVKIHVIHHENLQNLTQYEKCLTLRDQGRHQELIKAINCWSTSSSDSAWLIRKGGLLAELGHYSDSEQLLETALLQIRKHRRRDQIDYSALSREGWLLWLARALKFKSFIATEDPFYLESTSRLRELNAYECNASQEFDELVSALKSAQYEHKPSITKRTDFFGQQRETYHMANGLPKEIRISYEIIRLADLNGFPPSIRHVNLQAPGLILSAQTLIKTEGWLGVLWTLRAAKASDDELQALSRTRIALLDERHVKLGRAYAISEIKAALECDIDQYEDFRSKRLGVAIEVYGRFVSRHDHIGYIPVWDLTLQLLTNERCQRNYSTHGPLKTLLNNLCRVSSEQLLIEKLPHLLKIPILPQSHFPEPADHWSKNLKWKESKNESTLVWRATIAFLLDTCLTTDSNIRTSALRRLLIIFNMGVLTYSEKQSFAKIVWDTNNCDEFGWPKYPLYPWAYFSFPEEKEGQCIDNFRRRHLNEKINIGDFTIRILGKALLSAEQNEIPFTLNDAERSKLFAQIEEWVRKPINPAPQGQLAGLFVKDTEDLQVLDGLIDILPKIQIPKNLASGIFVKIQLLEDRHPHKIMQIYPLLFTTTIERIDNITRKLRQAIVSSDSTHSSGACYAIWRWFQIASDNPNVPPPPEDIIGEVGYAIARRRANVLDAALQLALWLVRKGPTWARERILQDIETGVGFLIEEAKYDGTLTDNVIDLPLIRFRITQLAKAITTAYFNAPDIFTSWIDHIAYDPLQEVRTGLEPIEY